MLSWGKAFKAAFMTIIYWLVWAIIGGVLMAMGAVPMILGIRSGNIVGGGLVGILLYIIGALIALLGLFATVYKMQTDLIVGEIRKERGD